MFHFKHFSLYHEHSTLKIGTDSVLLAASVPLSSVHNILDIGCGCGVIAFCLAQRLSQYRQSQHFTGIDIDEQSICEARKNISIFPIYYDQQFDFQKYPLQEFSNNTAEKFDLIVSNPPYFGDSLKPTRTDRLLSKHRDNSLSFNDLVLGVSKILSANGQFYTILPPAEFILFHQETEGILHQHFLMEIKPTPTKKANRIIAGYSHKHTSMERLFLTIRDENNSFSQEYKTLTEEFYLK